jgi:hypothetical protein
MLVRTFFRSLTVAGIFATPLNSRFRKRDFGDRKKMSQRSERAKKGPNEHKTCWFNSNAIFVWDSFELRQNKSPYDPAESILSPPKNHNRQP